MLDSSLHSAVTAERNRLTDLNSRVARHRASKSTAMESLAKQEGDVRARTDVATRALSKTQTTLRALKGERAQLESGLSPARRSWLRWGEPMLGGVLLFLSIALIGATINHRLEIFLFELLGFCLALWVRR